MDVFVGSILAFGFNFPPRQWMQCTGQLLPISQYTALFSLLGVQYGGDGKVTFALPNLQGKMLVGQDPDNEAYAIGNDGGSNTLKLEIQNMPMHTHSTQVLISIPAYGDTGNTTDPTTGCFAVSTGRNIYSTEAPDVSMLAFPSNISIAANGSGTAMDVTSPAMVINYCIAIGGNFPARN